jgi:hypothetical protein
VALAFGGWSFTKMLDYKNNADKKVAVAIAAAEKSQAAKDKAQFDEESKSPNKQFNGSAAYGSVSFSYPKSWSAYIDTTSSSEPINGYFYPDVVPGFSSGAAFALRVELVGSDYANEVQSFNSKLKSGKVVGQAYVPPKMNGVTNAQAGMLFSGQVNSSDSGQTGSMLIIKVRDKTLKVSTQSKDYLNDFNNTVLAGLTFNP